MRILPRGRMGAPRSAGPAGHSFLPRAHPYGQQQERCAVRDRETQVTGTWLQDAGELGHELLRHTRAA